MKQINIAIVGTGKIANTYVKVFKNAQNVNVYAVQAISKEEAQAFADKYDIEKAYSTPAETINDENVDLVYIATPHTLHYDMSKLFLEAGKNVLCEKPVTLNAKEAEELYKIAKEKNLFFSEAMWTRFLPVTKTIRDLLDNGRIGNIKFITASTAGNAMHNERMTSPELAGGMLLDCGIYVITSIFMLLGENYKDFSTSCVLSDKGVDLRSITTLNYENDITATMFMSMESHFENKITISGDKGYMEVQVPYNWQKIKIYSTTGEVEEEIDPPEQTSWGREYIVDAVAKAILDGKTYCEEASPEKILAVMHLMDDMRKEWGLRYPSEH